MNPPESLWLLTSAARRCALAALLGLAALALLVVTGVLWPLAVGAGSGQERRSACGPGDRCRVAMAQGDHRMPRVPCAPATASLREEA